MSRRVLIGLAGVGLLIYSAAASASIRRPGGISSGGTTLLDRLTTSRESFELEQETPLIVTVPDNETSGINWAEVNHFTPDEFHGQTDLIEPRLVVAIDQLREILGGRLRISPAPGAIARDYGSDRSQHWVGDLDNPVRLSTGIDLFPLDNSLGEVYAAAKQVPMIGGVGLYPDWSPSPGVHVDIRPRKLDGTLAEWMYQKLAGYTSIDWQLLTKRGLA